MNLCGLHDLSALRASTAAFSRPPLRVSLELVRKHPVETRNKDFQVVAGAYSLI